MSIRNATQLKTNEESKIKSIVEDETSCRLLELGFTPGHEIKLTRKSILGSTMFFCLGEKHFALRKDEALKIIIEH